MTLIQVVHFAIAPDFAHVRDELGVQDSLVLAVVHAFLDVRQADGLLDRVEIIRVHIQGDGVDEAGGVGICHDAREHMAQPCFRLPHRRLGDRLGLFPLPLLLFAALDGGLSIHLHGATLATGLRPSGLLIILLFVVVTIVHIHRTLRLLGLSRGHRSRLGLVLCSRLLFRLNGLGIAVHHLHDLFLTAVQDLLSLQIGRIDVPVLRGIIATV